MWIYRRICRKFRRHKAAPSEISDLVFALERIKESIDELSRIVWDKQ